MIQPDTDRFLAKCDVCERLGTVPSQDGLLTVGPETTRLDFVCPACDNDVAVRLRTDGATVTFLLNCGVPMVTDVFRGLPVKR